MASKESMGKPIGSAAASARCALLALFVLTAPGFSETTYNTSRPYEPRSESAQSLFEKGLTAAKNSDFAGAARLFAKARKADPANVNILFNLGLAESRMPGWELPALESFAMFLTANPQAKNAGEIRRHTDVLLARVENAINETLASAREIIEQFRRDSDRKNTLSNLSQQAVELLNGNRRPKLGPTVAALRKLVDDDSAVPASQQWMAAWLEREDFTIPSMRTAELTCNLTRITAMHKRCSREF
jgi:hypothetical protein